MTNLRGLLRVAAASCILSLLAVACGSGPGDGTSPRPTPVTGGTLRIAAAGDVDSIDPGRVYTSFGFMLFRVMVRTLVAYAPVGGEAGNRLDADLASDLPSVSSDGLTYTFTLRGGVTYQPEVASGRDIVSRDIRYAIERGFYPSVANPYAGLYFRDLFAGDEEFLADPRPDVHISGIDVGDPRKIIFRLKRPAGDFLHRLALPLAAPVPEEYARQFDEQPRSGYGEAFASSGPYQLERLNATVVGYQPGGHITLVRNPNWKATTDPIRKAYPDRIEVTEGFDDLVSATDKIVRGEMDYNGDFTIPADKQRAILSDPKAKRRLNYHSTSCIRYVSLNTTIPPFDNPLVRQAVQLVIDKRAMRAVRGGERTGSVATHVLPPGLPGFKEVGGKTFDPYKTDDFAGDVEKAKDLMRQAGYADGVYTGGKQKLILAGENSDLERRTTQVIVDSLAKIGIKVERQEFKRAQLLARLGVPKSGIAVGASLSWCWDYPDAYTVLVPLFDGRRITPKGNTNVSLVDSPTLGELIDRAEAASGAERARLWAAADKFVMEIAPVVPWLWESSPHLVSERVVGFQFSLWSVSMDLAVVAVRQKA